MSGLKETVTDEVTDQVDAGDVVTGNAITDQLDGAKLGRAVGEAVGASLGRRAGDLLFGRLLSKLGIGDGEQSTRTGRVLSAVGVALARTLSKPQFRDPLESAVRDLVESREAAGEESDGEEADGEESAGEEAEGEEGEGDEESAPEIDAETLRSLKRDTYRDLLDRMDYSELQSLAKDAGVKANLKRDDLVDTLVEEFGDDSEGGEEDDESADEEGADESAEEGDGSDEDADEE